MGQNSVPWGLPRFDQRRDAKPMWLSRAISVCAALPFVFAIFHGMFSHEVIHVQLLPSQQNASKWVVEDFNGFYIVLDGLAGLGMVLSFEYGLGWYGRLQNGWSASRTVRVNWRQTHDSHDPCLQFLETCTVNQSRGIKRPFSMAHLIHSSLRPSAPGPSVHRRQLQRRSDQRHCSGVMVAALSIQWWVRATIGPNSDCFQHEFSP